MIIAIAKGRVFESSLCLLKKVGIEITEDLNSTRKLLLPTNKHNIQIMVVRSFDVPTYVEYGAADFGIVGKDVLLEHPLGNDCLEMIDLKIAPCRISLAGNEKFNFHKSATTRLKVATKYPNITSNFFSKMNMQVDIVKLYGAMELAPKVGLSNAIVDLVDTGKTLVANNLIEIQTICEISSRLIVNPIHLKSDFKHLNLVIEKFKKAV